MRVEFCTFRSSWCTGPIRALIVVLVACSFAITGSHAAGASAAVGAAVSGCPQGSGSCFDTFAGFAGTPLGSHNAQWKRATAGPAVFLSGGSSVVSLPSTATSFYYAASTSDASQITVPATASSASHSRQACVRMASGVEGYCVSFGKVVNGMYSGCPVTRNGKYMGNGDCGSPLAKTSHSLAITASGSSPVTLHVVLDGVAVGSVADSSNPIGAGHPGFSITTAGLPLSEIDTWRDAPEVQAAAVAAAPVFHPAAGTYSTAQAVTISSPTQGATVFYTTDGSTPTTASPWFRSPIAIRSTTTLRAIAYKVGVSPSAIASSAYSIASATVAAPVFSVPSPYSGLGTVVGITDATSGSRILYCIDTTNTCTPSLQYISAIPFVSTGYIRAVGVLSGETTSAVSSWKGTWSTVSIATTTCPSGTQYQTYAGCTISATGGVPPYTFGWSTTSSNSLVEGLKINSLTGQITGTAYGQGTYEIPFTVTDFTNTTVTKTISIAVAGNNTLGGCSLFPSDSVWHMNVASLPVDTSVFAPFLNVYAPASLHMVFGTNVNDGGMPFMRVPYNQAMVPVSTTVYQSYFTSAPIPSYAPVEGTQNSGTDADRHVLVLQTAGGGNNCKLWEMYQGTPTSSGWTDSSNAYWDLGSYAMLPQDNGSTDAAGLPITPLLYNYDEVAGNCAAGAECGVVTHPGRLTLNHTLNYHVWPATAQSGLSICSGGYEDYNHLLSQSNPPTSCGEQSPMGEIYRLKSSVASPAACSGHPQAQVILTALRNYGLIVADNGITGGVVATADSRWNDADLACLTNLTLTDFEPVNVSSKMIDLNSSQVRP